jgi:DNA (cytosine-5)-methyltransferase 1
MDASAGSVLPTPTTDDANNTTRASGDFQSLARTAHNLLPTPTAVDMGRGKTVDEWDEWTDRMRAEHGNGNGHGRSLEIEAMKLLPTPTC